MAYKYAEIWNRIKQNQSVEIVLHRDIAPTVIQGLKRTKCAENVGRSSVGLIPWSKLVVKKEVLSEKTGMIKVTFSLLYDTRV